MSLGEILNLAAPEYAKPSEPPWLDGLIYRGKRHALSGPPEAAKTLAALIFMLTAMRHYGTRVAFIDFESGPAETRRLLEDLGATPEEVESVLYLEPEGPPDSDDELLAKTVHEGAELVVIDATAGAYDVSGLSEMDRGDIEKFGRIWVKPIWKAGIATLLIDHVVKNRNNRGAYAIGGERKLGGVDVHLGLNAVTQLSRGTSGLIKISTHKDRPAWLSRPRAADLELHSDPQTHAITWTFKPPSDQTEDGGWRPTFLMERVSRYLERQAEDVTVTTIYRDVKGKRETLGDATAFLVEDGYASERVGNRGSRQIRTIKPYREPSPSGSPSFPNPDYALGSPVPPAEGGDGNQDQAGTQNGHISLVDDDREPLHEHKTVIDDNELEQIANVAREYEPFF